MRDINTVDISVLSTYKSNFENEKEQFNENSYSTFSSSYLKNCSDPYVKRMALSLAGKYQKIKKGYQNIDSWWNDYFDNINGLENFLSRNGNSGSISESSIRNFAVNHLRELKDYKNKISDALNKDVSSTLGSLIFQTQTVSGFTDQFADFFQDVLKKDDTVEKTNEIAKKEMTAETNAFTSEQNDSFFGKFFRKAAATVEAGVEDMSSAISAFPEAIQSKDIKGWWKEEVPTWLKTAVKLYVATQTANSNETTKEENLRKQIEEYEPTGFFDAVGKAGLLAYGNLKDMKETVGDVATGAADYISEKASDLGDALVNTGAACANLPGAIWNGTTDTWWNEEVPEYIKTTADKIKSVAADVVVVGESVVHGVGNLGENLFDAGVLLDMCSAEVNSFVVMGNLTVATGIYDAYQAVSSSFTGKEWSSATKAMWITKIKVSGMAWNSSTGFTANKYVDSWSDSFYQDTIVGQFADKNAFKQVAEGIQSIYQATGLKLLENVTQQGITTGVKDVTAGLSYELGMVALTLLTGGGSAALGGIAAGAGFGNGAQNAYAQGASVEDGLLYAVASGAWDGVTHYAGAKLANVNLAGTETFARRSLNSMIRVEADTLTGAVEGYIRPLLATIYSDQTFAELYEQSGGAKGHILNIIVSAGTSAIGEGFDLKKAVVANDIETTVKLDMNTTTKLDVNETNVSVTDLEGIQKANYTKNLFNNLINKYHSLDLVEGSLEMNTLRQMYQDFTTDAENFLLKITEQSGSSILYDKKTNQFRGSFSAEGIDNIKVYGTNEAELRVRIKNTVEALKQMPAELKKNVREVNIFDCDNPLDNYWAVRYNKLQNIFYSAATGGHGQINVWCNSTMIDTIRHEAGHCLDTALLMPDPIKGLACFSERSEWAKAIELDELHSGKKAVTEYAANAVAEDFAEAIKLFTGKETKEKFIKNFPNRAEILDFLLSDIKQSQANSINLNSSISAAAPMQAGANIRQKLDTAFGFSGDEHYGSIILNILDHAANNEKVTNKSVKTILENFDRLKEKNPKLDFWAWKENKSAFWGPQNSICLNRKVLDRGVDGASAEVFHEIGHAIFGTLEGDANNWWQVNIDDTTSQILKNARVELESNQNSIIDVLKKADESWNKSQDDADVWYDTIKLEEEAKVSKMVDELFETGNQEGLKNIVTAVAGYQSVKEILKNAGVSIEEIDTIIKNSDLMKQLAIRQNRFELWYNHKTMLDSSYTHYGDDRKMSSMLNSITQNGDSIKLEDGSEVYYTYGHGNDYWTKYGVEEANKLSYDELIADFFSLQANGRTEALEKFRKFAGEELYNSLQARIDNWAAILSGNQ